MKWKGAWTFGESVPEPRRVFTFMDDQDLFEELRGIDWGKAIVRRIGGTHARIIVQQERYILGQFTHLHIWKEK